MSTPSPSLPQNKHTLVAVLTAAAVILAPILSFSVQPMTGKYLLPVLGGTATTWLSTLIFFQICVLIGYLSAYAVLRLPVRVQVIAVAAIAVLSLVLLQLPPAIDPDTKSIPGLLAGLSFSMLLPVTFLFMTGIILHDWLGVYRGSIPWYLYALSNLGSIAALLTYPFFIEPLVDLSAQSTVWHILLGLLVVLILILGKLRLDAIAKNTPTYSQSSGDSISSSRVAVWVFLSFLACLLLMSSTQELTAELGSHPLAWVIPLALYLGSFSLTFSGFWKRQYNLICGLVFTVLMTLFIWKQGLGISSLDRSSILLLLASTGLGCVFLHGTLYQQRSQRSFAILYIMVATGGCAAGLFSTLVAPFIFNRNYEFYIASLGAISVAGYLVGGSRPLIRIAIGAALLLPAVWLLSGDLSKLGGHNSRVTHTFIRTIFGQSIIETQPGRIAILSDVTLHGSQILLTDKESGPTTYFHEGSGVGMMFEYLDRKNDSESNQIGVIGLGAGTLAYYGKEGDVMTFWDIDPSMLAIASGVFSYIENSKAEIHFKLEDGRLGVRAMEEPFDILIVDAFSGDTVPTHLLTEEAYKEFRKSTPNGWMVYHISSRWLDLRPVLQSNLEALGEKGVRIQTSIPAEDMRKKDFQGSNYIVVPPQAEYEAFLAFLRTKIETNPYIERMRRIPSDTYESIQWTDGRHSVTQLLW